MRRLLNKIHEGEYVGDMVYGANDGIVTTFAVVAGATGALLSPGVIVILGLANIIADGFSMGASNYLAIQSQQAMERSKTGFSRADASPFEHGLVTFFAFIIAGFLPLVPYLFAIGTLNTFLLSSIVSALTFFSIGAARTLLTKDNALTAGMQMLAIGGLASFVAYGIGWAVRFFFGVSI